jgi:lipopolysaccharide/colanic/teichoic acid biosynthesis glycosyltransferase
MMRKLSPELIGRFTTRIAWLERTDPSARLLRDRQYDVAKRCFDLLLVGISLPIWAPALGICALLVKLESPRDPLLFVQERTGRFGKRFRMFKFRTMVKDADQQKTLLRGRSAVAWPDFHLADDPRVTFLGKHLRKTGLDELPQILNVIRGEMSLVGPRPTSFSSQDYALWQTERLEVMPGITGLWQILGRGTTQFDERLRLDIAYIYRRCIWLDTQILARTVTMAVSALLRNPRPIGDDADHHLVQHANEHATEEPISTHQLRSGDTEDRLVM